MGGYRVISQDSHLTKRRLDWASAGIDRLEVLVDAFLATKPSEVIASVKRKGESAHISYVLHIYSQPPPEIRFAVGDVVHNLRASLDNLVWGVGQVCKADNNLGLEFHDSESSFRDCYLPKISKLPDPIQDWITSIQPYHRRKHMPMLHRLHNLWNRDKHRSPNVISTAGETGTLGYSGESMPFESMTWERVGGQKDQQKIATAIIPWERRSEFEPEFIFLVAFDETGIVGLDKIVGRSESVVDYLRHIQKYIFAEVVPKFEPYL